MLSKIKLIVLLIHVLRLIKVSWIKQRQRSNLVLNFIKVVLFQATHFVLLISLELIQRHAVVLTVTQLLK